MGVPHLPHAEIERALEVFHGIRRTKIAVLREGDELKIEIGLHAAAHFYQRLHSKEPVVADVDMRAHREQTSRDGKVTVSQRPLHDRFVCQQRLQLAPERDAFEQRARLVHSRQPERQRRVHMEMAIDEGRGDEAARGVDRLARLGGDAGLDRDDATDKEIEGHG